jgi:hypothetical protein
MKDEKNLIIFTMWTLVYSGTEKALGDWGLCADFAVELVNKGRDSVTMRSTEPFDGGAPQFAWGSAVTVYRDRTLTGSAWGGGSIFFQGYVGDTKRLDVNGRQNIQYSFYGTWWLLERLIFQQQRQVFNGWVTPGVPTSGATLTPINTPEVFLGQTLEETYQTNGAEITEILNWVNECYNPTKQGATSGRNNAQDVVAIGTIDPTVNFPVTRANSIFCSEAVTSVLRWSPDCVCWFDYTTTPPTFNCRALANLSAATIEITADQERQVELAPRYERQLAGVYIEYKLTNTFNGVAWTQFYNDIYPGTINQYTPNCSRHFVELDGSKVARTSVAVLVTPVAGAVSDTASDRLAWWLGIDQTLNDPQIDPASIAVGVATVLDANGNPVNLEAYPNVLAKGQLSTWMAVQWVDCTVTADVSFVRYADPTIRLQKNAVVTTRQLSHRVTLTNAISQTYYTTTYYDPGEAVPTGVAQAVYASLSTLQYSGRVDFVAGQVQSGVSVGNLLTLEGPTNTYSNLLVQSVRAVPHLGLLTVTYAPSARLDAPELIELARASRWRIIYNMPTGRSTGQAAETDVVGLGSATAKENTQYGVPDYSFRGITFDQGTSGGNPNGITHVEHDASAEHISIYRLNPATGALVTADGAGNPIGQIGQKLSDAEGQVIRVGRVHYTDPTGAAKVCWMLRSAGIADPPAFGANAADDVFLGGSGAGGLAPLVAMVLQSVQNDYVTAWPAIPLPLASLVSVLATGTTATPHGITVGQSVSAVIAGATPAGYNGTFTITATAADEFTYALPSALANASGTMTVTIASTAYSLSTLISGASTTATATTASPHGIAIGTTANVNIAGATPSGYDGAFIATAITATVFTYPLASTLASPATGAITYQADVYLAKPWKLRCSRTTETDADGTVWNFTYGAGPDANNVQRTKTGAASPAEPESGLSEVESVAPEWLVGDIFYALPAATGVNDANSHPITLLIAGETRAWTAVAS